MHHMHCIGPGCPGFDARDEYAALRDQVKRN